MYIERSPFFLLSGAVYHLVGFNAKTRYSGLALWNTSNSLFRHVLNLFCSAMNPTCQALIQRTSPLPLLEFPIYSHSSYLLFELLGTHAAPALPPARPEKWHPDRDLLLHSSYIWRNDSSPPLYSHLAPAQASRSSGNPESHARQHWH